MGFLVKLRKWFIGEALEEISDFYEERRMNMTYVICLTMTFTMVLLSLNFAILGKFEIIPFSGTANAFFIGELFLLKFTKSARIVAFIMCLFSYLLILANYLLLPDVEHYTETLWVIDIFLFAFFVLGKKWGLFFMAISTTLLAVNIRFIMPHSVEVVAKMSGGEFMVGIMDMVISSGVMYYCILQFVRTTGIAEEKFRKVNIELTEQYTQIQKQNDMKVQLLRETHHRVKNNFQMVNSILRLQSFKLKNKKLISVLEETQDRIRAMAVLHESMYKFRDFEKVQVKEFFGSIINSLIEAYSGEKEITSAIEIEVETMDMNTAIPLGLIINELVTNSLKYAFTGRESGKIIFHLKSVENNLYEMITGDDGVGTPETKPKDEEHQTLGSELIEVFTEQLDGKMERLAAPGTMYKFTFKAG